jgi:hypothetical protein
MYFLSCHALWPSAPCSASKLRKQVHRALDLGQRILYACLTIERRNGASTNPVENARIYSFSPGGSDRRFKLLDRTLRPSWTVSASAKRLASNKRRAQPNVLRPAYCIVSERQILLKGSNASNGLPCAFNSSTTVPWSCNGRIGETKLLIHRMPI